MILKKPLVTEKSNLVMDKTGKIGFIVDHRATKDEIKAEVEKFYNVEVESVNTMIQRGKARRNRRTGQISGYTAKYKKAFVTLKEGFNIDFFENV
ncbi:MAG: 50S ribosomal protein L23 [Bacteroidia bacterium]|jgi:large subunit ribosomal protein L23